MTQEIFREEFALMSKIRQFIKNISPLNDRTEMPVTLYIMKVILIFWFVKFGTELIGEGVVIVLHFVCGKNPLKGEMFAPDTTILIVYYGYALMIGMVLLYWKFFQKKTASELGFTKKAGTYFVGAAAGAVLVAVSAVLAVLAGAISYNGVFGNINTGFILLMLGGFICQGTMEEVLCRGIVMQLLKNKASIPVAITVSSALFIIPHLSKMTETGGVITFFAIINLILISMVFSLFTLYFTGIWAACGFHTVWNFILYNIFGLNLSGNGGMSAAVFDMRSTGDNALNGGIYGIEASVIATVVLTVTVVVMFVIIYGKGRTADGIQ